MLKGIHKDACRVCGNEQEFAPAQPRCLKCDSLYIKVTEEGIATCIATDNPHLPKMAFEGICRGFDYEYKKVESFKETWYGIRDMDGNFIETGSVRDFGKFFGVRNDL